MNMPIGFVRQLIEQLEKKLLTGSSITKEEALTIAGTTGYDMFQLFLSASRIRSHFLGERAGLCSIVNAKSGACPEDCSFCAQSSKSTAAVDVYPLMSKDVILERAHEAQRAGVQRFSIVTSGKRVTEKDVHAIAEMITEIKKLGLIPCVSLGMLEEKDLTLLKEAGLDRYHHNLETSKRFFPFICSTHTYSDKIQTINSIKSAGLSLCSGGIFGMGETWQDRINMAFVLKELDVDSVPINFLIPIKGTSLEHLDFLHPFEALKIVSLYRFILPQKEIRVCGGRIQVLNEFNSLIFLSGADSLLTGNYLTTQGINFEDDLSLIKTYGLTVSTG
jgi:biotin synthase